MRVLHLPLNIASQIAVTVRALRDSGVAARGLVVAASSSQAAEQLELLDLTGSRARRLRKTARYLPHVFAALRWADLVHWHFATPALPLGLDLAWARLLGKPGLVEFWGSDIRISEVEAADNPYYARVKERQEYRALETRTGSLRRQRRFAAADVEALTSCPSMLPYIERGLFPTVHMVRQRIYLPDYIPRYPGPGVARPLVIHSPTAPIIKGTAAVEAAVEQLGASHAFDFKRVTGMSHVQAMQLLGQCDIFVDQLVLGAHGLAALEAMAYGKPVVCYLKPSMAGQYPADLPIVSATQETLPEVLRRLLEDGQLRHELGRRGRAYVEKYHDAQQLARQLQEIYVGVLARHGRGSRALARS